ncbi:VanY-A/VanY-F/VanY-M family D-Ala-D-Ala carboxypeptidase [Lederbergia lenta]|uniref:D-alanyl-D-alanine carboxypeptidase n=1 Tax=Lederbergia lenta TaxID=1467 RepID=A0A2X4YX01_LEDLE|nr:VanY-A/VanY-F/VanY-M family D-Ala-D-Ala carboxypeptidase [Lederbergia lenta]MEC2323495.1 VanY-A/VanY-F/VanY-M family D-Ala-D-Ala carboxypeptidase [Lederbergia lenta]SQI52884.1 D-alanyl-D-alanine carboxypeptidase [Lederbergia lenta]
MKKWGFFLFLIACLCLAFVYITLISQDKVEIQQIDPEKDALDYQGHSERIQQEEITKEQIYQGNLLLVNNEYPVHEESIKSDVVNLSIHNELTEGYVLLGSEIYLSKEIAHIFSEMITDARKDGLHSFATTSGFRSFEEQNILYQEMGSLRALPPGYSEHNFGLALDVGSTQMKMEDAPEGKWIGKNAWKYGFILRYPKDKTDITGIQYEPWHIRYVGLPHSAIMYEKNLVLEEYLDYLKEEQDISVNVNGEKYTVSYYPVSQGLKIKVPVNHHYEISGNNMDGVIVTVYE